MRPPSFCKAEIFGTVCTSRPQTLEFLARETHPTVCIDADFESGFQNVNNVMNSIIIRVKFDCLFLFQYFMNKLQD